MRVLKLLALVLGAAIPVPSGAHLLEIAHKFSMDRETYFAVQRIYADWALSGIVIVVAIIVDTMLFLRLKARDRFATFCALASAALIGLGLVVFFVWVYPANATTGNWTTETATWEALRKQWEYGHVAIAGLTFGAFIAIAFCVVRSSKTVP